MTSIPVLIFISFAMNLAVAIRALNGQRRLESSKASLSSKQYFDSSQSTRGQDPAILKSEPSSRNNLHLHEGSHRRMQGTRNIQPLSTSLSPNATFSACLLVRDDNAILSEWLAYHYFVLNLRHLIVAIDPLSSESPSKILERWRSLTDLQVTEWTDPDYMTDDFLDKGRPPKKDVQKDTAALEGTLGESDLLEVSIHRYRQRHFLGRCMREHRDLGHSWVIHIDTDEFVVSSKLLRQLQPDYLEILPMDQPGSVLHLLQEAVKKTSALVNYPCVSMLRLIFGSVESPRADAHSEVGVVPEAFNAASFETLRWKYHGAPSNRTLHGNPKVILDVAAIPEESLPDEAVFSIHRPVSALCRSNAKLKFGQVRKQPIAVNHYLGSWERYNGRQDKRRNREIYRAKADQRTGTDDGARLWLKGFVATMGLSKARRLLGEAYLAHRPAKASRIQSS